jgi:ribosomal protein L11 methyltransferase
MHPDSPEEKRVWQLITLNIDREAEEFASSALFDLGATGLITLEETAESIKLGAYFDERSDAEEIARSVEAEFARAGHAAALLGISITSVPEQDWMQKWKEGFEAITIGKRLVVAPSWKLPDETDGRAVIQIDPGMAFGTGTHETTRLCLVALEKYFAGGTLLDVGTGTGILAIAAAKLDARARIEACDTDAEAVEIARENATLNGVAAQVNFRAGTIEETGASFDCVCANLTADVILPLLPALIGATCGRLILSGILDTQADAVRARLAELGVSETETASDGEWVAIVV